MIARLFTDHPSAVDETYLQHAFVAGRFAALLFLAGSAALLHAIIPAFCERTASRLVGKLNAELQSRH